MQGGGPVPVLGVDVKVPLGELQEGIHHLQIPPLRRQVQGRQVAAGAGIGVHVGVLQQHFGEERVPSPAGGVQRLAAVVDVHPLEAALPFEGGVDVGVRHHIVQGHGGPSIVQHRWVDVLVLQQRFGDGPVPESSGQVKRRAPSVHLHVDADAGGFQQVADDPVVPGIHRRMECGPPVLVRLVEPFRAPDVLSVLQEVRDLLLVALLDPLEQSFLPVLVDNHIMALGGSQLHGSDARMVWGVRVQPHT
mmetsp:Transcript_114956/g.199960  ORF Transcript_114956/g.199960 Transcript_114956/m.199960 type:complete len:248 (-) Transcript_114956:1414-2157(-)